MKKNTLIAFILSAIVLGVSMYIQLVYFPPAPPEETKPSVAPASTQTVPQNTFVQTQQVVIHTEISSDNAGLAEQQYTIQTPLIEATFTNKGGDIISYQLREHFVSDSNEYVQMAKNISSTNRAFSLALGSLSAPIVNELFEVEQKKESNGVQSIIFKKKIMVKNSSGNTDAFVLAKRYRFFPDNYMFELDVVIDAQDSNIQGLNFNGAGYTLRTNPQIGPKWDTEDKYEYRNFMAFLENKGKAQTYTLSANTQETVEQQARWMSVSGKYFCLVILPMNPSDVKMINFSTVTPQTESVQNNQIALVRQVIGHNLITDTYRIYIGPCTENYLAPYNIATQNPFKLADTQIDQVSASSGILYPLEIALKWLLQLFYWIIPNWGVAIILVTATIKMVFYPLTKKGFIATQRMQELQPQIQAIQQKYKGNPQKLNEEMARFYREAGYNPLSGCLPLLIQMPILFAMYGLFNNYFEFRGAMFIPHWIPDLSVGDSIWQFPAALPLLHWTHLRLLPILYAGSQMIFTKITQPPATNNQQSSSMKMMMYIMPMIFFFLFYNAPSGLLVYWTAMNLFTLVQQVYIKRRLHHSTPAKRKSK